MTSILSTSDTVLELTREYIKQTVKNTRFAEYMLLAIDEAAEGNDWRFQQCANLKWMPVDMEEFLLGTAYMDGKGHLYPLVIDELLEMNAGGITEVLLTGGIGSAKTTCALYTTAYQLYLLSCYKSPHRQFALDPHSELLTVFQSITEKKARQVGYDRFKSMILTSQYFKEHFAPDPHLKSSLVFPNRIEVRPVSGSQFAAIGENVIGGLIDELNYMDVIEQSKRSIDGGVYDQAVAVYNSIARRRKTRFHELGELPGLLCLVSSRRYPGQFTDTKEEEALNDPTIYVYDKRVWEVKPEGTFKKGFFPIFVGDPSRKPRVLRHEEKMPKVDAHLIDHIPEEFRVAFETDIFDALREVAGKSTLSRHPFMANREAVNDAMNTGRKSIFTGRWCDFDTKECKIATKNFTDLHHLRFAHVDLGLTSDSAGLAIGHVPEFLHMTREGLEHPEIMHKIIIDGVMEIRPPRGGEIKFWKIRDIIYKLRENGLDIRWVTYDSYQSVDSLQILHNQGLTTGTMSMDKDRLPYEMLKSCIYDHRIEIPKHKHLNRELVSLEDIPMKGKVDHPPRGTKDCADAVAGVVYGLMKQRVIYVRHGVSLSRVPDAVSIILSRNQKMRVAEDEIRAMSSN